MCVEMRKKIDFNGTGLSKIINGSFGYQVKICQKLSICLASNCVIAFRWIVEFTNLLEVFFVINHENFVFNFYM